MYKRLSGIHSLDEVEELADEIHDRFGRPPAPVRRLVDVVRVRALGADVGATKITVADGAIHVELESSTLLTSDARHELTHEFGPRLKLAWRDNPGLQFRLRKHGDEDVVAIAKRLLTALGEL